ncbi:hypothetical protein ACFQ1S_26470 [Kibdelosporangium lantanae]|uniref:Uncharacterized protein n=1 Tax=Kibdelosporangium lantanae TaxID=1497396 RepID=A0ABW3MGX1_9PSEU
MSENASKQSTRQRATGDYQSGLTARSPFDFTVDADQALKYVDDNNYRIDAWVHMGRQLGRTADDIDTTGGFGRTNGVLDYADGHATQHYRGQTDQGRCYDRTLVADHGWITRDTSAC